MDQQDEHLTSLEHEKNKQKQTTETIEKIIKTKDELTKIEREITRDKKDIRHIEKSNTWKYSKPLRQITGNQGKEPKNKLTQLTKELEQTKKELYETKKQLNERQLTDLQLNRNEVHQFMRDLKDNGQLIDYLNHFTNDKIKIQSNYKDALTYAARLYMNEPETYRHVIYSKILNALSIDEIPEFMIRAGLTEEPISLRQAASFRASLNMRMRQKQLVEPLPEWYFDDKQKAYEFIENLNIKTPWVADEQYTLTDLPAKEGIAIKPVDGAGSRGVYLVHSFNDIIDVKRSTKLDSWEELITRMKKDLNKGWVAEDKWLIEEIIYENSKEKIPARDVKFYSFYGKTGIILEIIRYPEVRQCWWTADGKRVRTGKYDEDLFEGKGVTAEELEMVAQISSHIPAPFIRIDFLRSENGLVFGEFTPKPGNYDEFDEPTDRWLGDYFLDAQGRLMNDLLKGKQFTAYEEFVEGLKTEGVKI